MDAHVAGIGIWAPGLAGWDASIDVLSGARAYCAAPLPPAVVNLLAPTERRRCGRTALLACKAAEEALTISGLRPEQLPTVFATSGGDLELAHEICTTLAQPLPSVSPTRFHNSVHNAAAGYWSIATAARAPSTSLSCCDHTFAAGLLEAFCQLNSTEAAVMLVAYDWPAPAPLAEKAHMIGPCGIALALTRAPSPRPLARLTFLLCGTGSETRLGDIGLEQLRVGVPAGRALPLIAAVASRRRTTVLVDYLEDRRVRIGVQPCD